MEDAHGLGREIPLGVWLSESCEVVIAGTQIADGGEQKYDAESPAKYRVDHRLLVK